VGGWWGGGKGMEGGWIEGGGKEVHPISFFGGEPLKRGAKEGELVSQRAAHLEPKPPS